MHYEAENYVVYAFKRVYVQRKGGNKEWAALMDQCVMKSGSLWVADLCVNVRCYVEYSNKFCKASPHSGYSDKEK